MTNYDDIARNLLARDQRTQRQTERRIEAAQIELDKLLAQFLEIDPALQTVILFGSLAGQRVRSAEFDIDLAVRCSPDKFLLLVGATLDSDFKIDLIDLTSTSQTFRQFILAEGVVLYEKQRNPEDAQS